MTQHLFTALVPVTATGHNEADAREYARGILDDTLQRMDDQHPAGNLSTGPAVLIDPLHLLTALTGIRETIAAAYNGEIGRITALGSIDRATGALLAALAAPPATEQAATPAGRDAER
jgi:hypothetical protein